MGILFYAGAYISYKNRTPTPPGTLDSGLSESNDKSEENGVAKQEENGVTKLEENGVEKSTKPKENGVIQQNDSNHISLKSAEPHDNPTFADDTSL